MTPLEPVRAADFCLCEVPPPETPKEREEVTQRDESNEAAYTVPRSYWESECLCHAELLVGI